MKIDHAIIFRIQIDFFSLLCLLEHSVSTIQNWRAKCPKDR